MKGFGRKVLLLSIAPNCMKQKQHLARASPKEEVKADWQRNAQAQGGRPKRNARRPARLADGAEMTSDDEGLDLLLLTGAAPRQEPSAAGAKREKLEAAKCAPSGAGNTPAESLGASAAQEQGANREDAPRRSGRHRTHSRMFEEAVADAAARVHSIMAKATSRRTSARSRGQPHEEEQDSQDTTAPLHLPGKSLNKHAAGICCAR